MNKSTPLAVDIKRKLLEESGPPMELRDLSPSPVEEWERMLHFVGLDGETKAAISQSIEVIFRRGPEFVVDTYDYLQSVPETASILGWEESVDEAHLEERRRFFTVWLARCLGMDTSEEFAYYLFRAGKFHAGHGPRQIHTPPAYITASVGLTLASFSQYMSEADMSAEEIAEAMAGWSKYLSIQINQMEMGYKAARELDRGQVDVTLSLYGRLRHLLNRRELSIHINSKAGVEEALRKFFDYFPQARAVALERIWHSQEKPDSRWVEVEPAYTPKGGCA